MTRPRAKRLHGPGVTLLVACVLVPAIASAQEGPQLREHHLMLGAGLAWSGSYGIGDAAAQLRGNSPGTTPPSFTLFRAESNVAGVIAPAVTVGVALTRRLAIEAGAAFERPHVAVTIAGDPEAPAQELLGEKLDQYRFEAGLNWQLPIAMGSRLAPFISVGGGYLRQLHEDRTLAETGQIYYAGAGARYWLRGQAGRSLAVGLRGDVRVNLRRQGIDFADQMRVFPTLSLAAFLGL